MRSISVLCCIVLGCLASGAVARPRFLIVPMDQVRFVNGYQAPMPYYQMPGSLRREIRSAFPQDEDGATFIRPLPKRNQNGANRRQEAVAADDVPAFSIPSAIRQSEDAIAAGSSYDNNHGPDYVDYGAYTGGYGAFGWYTDHPVLVYGSH